MGCYYVNSVLCVEDFVDEENKGVDQYDDKLILL
jgi:hypothetical protein